MNHTEKGAFGQSGKEKPFDPIQAKQEIQQALKDNLAELRSKMEEEDLSTNPLELVFQASLEDGLAFAKDLRLSPDEIQKLVSDVWFTETHKDVVKEAGRIAGQMNLSKDEVRFWKKSGDHEYEDGVPKPEALESMLKVRKEEREEAYSPEMRALLDKLENYYREFLPYRMDSEKKRRNRGGEDIPHRQLTSWEQFSRRREEHVRKGEGIIFDKYTKELAAYLPNVTGSEQDYEKLADLGIPGEEARDIIRLARAYQKHVQMVMKEAEQMRASGAKAGDEVLPVIVMNANGVKREFNLARDRKPVAKIIEQMVKKEVVGDAQKILNESGTGGGYTVEKDSVTNRFVPIKELPGFKRHEIEQMKGSTENAWRGASDFFSKQKPPSSDSIADIGNWIGEIAETDEWKAYEKNMPKEEDLPISVELEIAQSISNPYLKRHIENFALRKTIDNKYLRGVPQLLMDMAEGKQPTSLSPEEIGAIYAYYEDHANCKDISGLPENRRVEADKMIGLANAMENPALETLVHYFVPKSKTEREKEKAAENKSLKEWVSTKLKSIDFLRKAMSEKITGLLHTISAKPDTNPRLLAEKLLKACYPREWYEYESAQQRSRRPEFAGALSGGRGNRGFESSEEGLSQDRFESALAGGNFGGKEFQEGTPKKLATFDTPVSGMFVTNILGYDPVAGTWKRNYVPIDGDVEQDRSMTKVTAKLDSKIGRIVPAPIAARAFKAEGVNSQISKDSLGLLHLEGPREISGWSYQIPAGTVVPGAIDENTYTRFLSRFIAEGGAGYLEKNPDLPVECKMFVESIKTLSPRDRVIKIQEFVTSKSFYDAYDNPIRDQMNDAPFAERCALMKERLEQLKEQLGDQVPPDTMFAGVCADFAMLTESMYREAGIASAVIEGYNMSGTEMTSHNAHGKSGVFWPDANGKTILAEIETTPSARTEAQSAIYQMQGIAPEPIALEIERAHAEEEKAAEEIAQDITALEGELEKMLRELSGEETLAKQLSLEERKALEEQTLALRAKIAEFVQQTANLKDIAVLKGVLDAVRFSPVLKSDQSDIDSKVSGMKFVQSEYDRLQKEYDSREVPLERISHLGRNFVGDLDAMLYNSRASGEGSAFTEYVGQVGEYGGRKIPENHAKIWSMLKTYMRARLV